MPCRPESPCLSQRILTMRERRHPPLQSRRPPKRLRRKRQTSRNAPSQSRSPRRRNDALSASGQRRNPRRCTSRGTATGIADSGSGRCRFRTRTHARPAHAEPDDPMNPGNERWARTIAPLLWALVTETVRGTDDTRRHPDYGKRDELRRADPMEPFRVDTGCRQNA